MHGLMGFVEAIEEFRRAIEKNERLVMECDLLMARIEELLG